MKQKYFFANWKMYLTHSESLLLAEQLKKISAEFADELEVAVFPSALSVAAVSSVLDQTPIGIGAQNVFWIEKGGYTGEISAGMYKEVGAEYALVGHSERRHLCGETNHMVRQKIEAIVEAELIPVLCVGETQAERAAGQAVEVVEAQLRAACANLTYPADRTLFVAYEPVWAIGTGETCEPSEVAVMHERIAAFVAALLPATKVAILYGGSVRPENAAALLAQPQVDGILVGASAVKADTWRALAAACVAAR